MFFALQVYKHNSTDIDVAAAADVVVVVDDDDDDDDDEEEEEDNDWFQFHQYQNEYWK